MSEIQCNYLDTVQVSVKQPQHDVENPEGTPTKKIFGSSHWVQMKDSALTQGVGNETSPFLAVKVFFKVDLKKKMLSSSPVFRFEFR